MGKGNTIYQGPAKEKEKMKTLKQSLKKYNLPDSDEFESSYCQNRDCPNNNRIKKGETVSAKRLIFCSNPCMEEVTNRFIE